jgi:hypothetical protein
MCVRFRYPHLLLSCLLLLLTACGATNTAHPPTHATPRPLQRITASFVVTGILPPGTARPDALQIPMHTITATGVSDVRTVQGTGVTQAGGTRATGLLLLRNGSGIAATVPANTVITTASGIAVVTNDDVQVPPANQQTQQFGQVSVGAHARDTGLDGNIAAISISGPCCASATNTLFASNPDAFTGGAAGTRYTFVRQADVDGVTPQLKGQAIDRAFARLGQQSVAGEMFTTHPQCQDEMQVSQPIGDTGVAIVSTQVSATSVCTVTLYSTKQLHDLIAVHLLTKASVGARLQGDITMQVRVQGPTTLLVAASGLYAKS